MKAAKQDETFLDTLVSWLNKQAQEKESKDNTKDESKTLGSAVVKVAESLSLTVLEVAKLTKSISNITKAVNEHSEMIQELYTIQNGILHILKSEPAVQAATKITSINNEKKKTEKPN